ncbi:uncharacterized protein F5147DRAFT_652715 [Suillus discolor]|uniref:Uncharacterized protein n=1 Tax=Suillus discolor TaxID=1912936 RepID=A0A9P7JUN2_9AGAM|nr:uncharacterized protein F5147DRAFT_652715 [Suillus discolor]KAG2108728.1 hypothetical protein F5147DRAFT_652715 [Suillus discolor]
MSSCRNCTSMAGSSFRQSLQMTLGHRRRKRSSWCRHYETCKMGMMREDVKELSRFSQMEYDKPSHKPNSKLTKVLKNHRLMVMLMKAISPLGPHYRKWRELSVRWLEQAMKVIMGMYVFYMAESSNLFLKLASKDKDIPMYHEVMLLVVQSHIDEWAQTALTLLTEKIRAGEDSDMTIFISVFDEIDKLAIQCFDTYEECISDDDDDYVSALMNYQNDLTNILEKEWLVVTKHSKQELVWLDKATLPMSDLARETQQLDAGVNAVKIGIGKINILHVQRQAVEQNASKQNDHFIRQLQHAVDDGGQRAAYRY